MDFFDLVSRRRSIRRYAACPVSERELARILECARAAPSAGNLQAFSVAVVRDPARRQALARAALNQEFVAAAPVVLVFLEDPDRSGRRYGARGRQLYALQDATIACTYAQLAATALGLGSCWVGAFDAERVGRAIAAPSSLVPVALLPLGHPAEAPAPAGRRSLESLVRDERLPG